MNRQRQKTPQRDRTYLDYDCPLERRRRRRRTVDAGLKTSRVGADCNSSATTQLERLRIKESQRMATTRRRRPQSNASSVTAKGETGGSDGESRDGRGGWRWRWEMESVEVLFSRGRRRGFGKWTRQTERRETRDERRGNGPGRADQRQTERAETQPGLFQANTNLEQ